MHAVCVRACCLGGWLLVVLLAAAPVDALGPRQADPTRARAARKIDEYLVGSLRSHDEQMRLWGAFDEFGKETGDARLAVVAYGPLPGSARRHAERVKNYWVNAHGLNPARVVTIDGGYRAERSVELWVVPGGAQEPVPSPSGSFERASDAAWKYDEYSLEGWWFASDYEKEPERLNGFAAALKSNPRARGYIVVHRGTIDCETCLRVGTEMKFAQQQREYLVRTHRIAPSRISLVRGRQTGGGRIQLWVVPSGASLPERGYNLPRNLRRPGRVGHNNESSAPLTGAHGPPLGSNSRRKAG